MPGWRNLLFFSASHWQNSIFLCIRSMEFAMFSCPFNEIRDFSVLDQRNFRFFHASLTKFTIFLCSIKEICDFFVPDQRNLQFLSDRQNFQFLYGTVKAKKLWQICYSQDVNVCPEMFSKNWC